MYAHLRELVHGLDLLIYPPHCLVCDALFDAATAHRICADCTKAMLADPFDSCPRCCTTLGPHTQSTGGCPSCFRESFAFDDAIRLGPYDGRLRDAVLRMKQLSGETLAHTIGLLWAERDREKFAQVRPDAILPIPLHWQRRIKRGYNQSHAIAESLARILQIPCGPYWLKRTRATPRQLTQSATARRENIRGAFRTTHRCRVRGLRVLLIDDVLTTGATAHEAARVLKEAGAAQVTVAVLAHR